MGAVIAWLFRGLTYLLSWLFRGGISLIQWAGTSKLGMFLTFGVSLFSVFKYGFEFIERLILNFIPGLPTDGYNFDLSSSFGDMLDASILSLIPNSSPFVATLKNVLYIVSLGELVNCFINNCLSFLLTIWLYKTIKSWLPTLAD